MQKEKIKLWAVLVWLLVWQLVSMRLNSDLLLVSPFAVAKRLAELAVTARYWRIIGYSLVRIGGGFLLALTLGILLACCAARYTRVRQLLQPLMQTIKTVPVASFIILALVWFSSKKLSTLISFLMVLPVIYTNMLEGLSARSRSMREMAEVFHLSRARRFRYIDAPQLMPFLLSGCRLGLGLCWKAGVAAEVIGMPVGSIGERLQQAKIYLNTPDLFAWTVTIVAISVGVEKLFIFLLTRLAKLSERM